MKRRKRYVLSYKQLFYHHPESQYFTSMTPDEFLSLAAKPVSVKRDTGEVKLVYSKRSLGELANRMRREKMIDPLFLDVDSSACRVVSHEGRHRARAAKSVGIDKLPVVLFCHSKGHYTKAHYCNHCVRKPGGWTRRLKPQYQTWPERLVELAKARGLAPARMAERLEEVHL